MASLDIPPATQSTVCELSCRLVNAPLQGAVAAAGTVGLAYPDIELSLDASPDPTTHTAPVFLKGSPDAGCYNLHEDREVDQSASSSSSVGLPLAERVASHLQAAAGPMRVLQRLFQGLTGVSAQAAPSSLPPAAWHPHKPCLAAVGARALVHVYDMAGVEGPGANGARGPEVLQGAPKLLLGHELQQEVSSLAWRPNSGSHLAVGSRGRVCLWTTSGSSRPPLGARGHAPWLSVLSCKAANARLTSLSWSPDGRLLAACSPDMWGLVVWDVGLGTAVQVSAGAAPLTMLRWSACGNYLFAAASGGRFFVYETARWACQAWDLGPAYDAVLAAAWAPAGTDVVLVALRLAGGAGTGGASPILSGSSLGLGPGSVGPSPGPSHQLLALHLVGGPPSLKAQLMPVVLPDINLQGGSRSQPGPRPAPPPGPGSIADLCWDPRGERLAVLLQGPHPAAGLIALYSTTTQPVVCCRLLGYARPPPLARAGAAAAAGAAGEAGGSEAGSAAATEEADRSAGPGSLSAHGCFAKGALFTLRLGGQRLYNLPLYYR